MASTDIAGKVRLTSVRLNSVNAMRGSSSGESRFKITRKCSLDLSEVTDRGFTIRLDIKVYCKPEGPMRLDLELLGHYAYRDANAPKMETAEIKPHLKALSEPLFSHASLVIAFLSEKMVNTPVVFPPFDAEQQGH